jgi:DNA-binding transcriptional LysR family regulator
MFLPPSTIVALAGTVAVAAGAGLTWLSKRMQRDEIDQSMVATLVEFVRRDLGKTDVTVEEIDAWVAAHKRRLDDDDDASVTN